MTSLGQVAWVLAALVAVGVSAMVVVARRRPGAPDPYRPRTVADLVRLRGEAAASDVGATAEKVTISAVVAPGRVVVSGCGAVGTEDAVDVVATTGPDPGATLDAGDPEPSMSPEGAAAASSVPALSSRRDPGDTPWGRAAWMGPTHTGTAPAPPVDPTGSRTARPPSAETVAAGAAVDLALLRTFGFTEPRRRPDGAPTVSLVGADGAAREDAAARRVGFRVVGRDGVGVAGTTVTLLDDRGRGSSGATADGDGRGEVWAVRPGRYVLVCTAPEHQPGAVAITVGDAPTEAEVLLARSGSLAGCVHGEDGPILGARLTLVQDGEIVDVVHSGAGGAYRIGDLTAGEYALTVTAADHEPVVALLHVPDGTGLRHDVALGPAGHPSAHGADGVDDDLVNGRR